MAERYSGVEPVVPVSVIEQRRYLHLASPEPHPIVGTSLSSGPLIGPGRLIGKLGPLDREVP